MNDTTDREWRVQEVITRLFVGTDRRDWAAVRRCFARTVLFDMTSLAGGSPASLTPDQITSAWETGLAPIRRVGHHVVPVQPEVSRREHGAGEGLTREFSAANAQPLIETLELSVGDVAAEFAGR